MPWVSASRLGRDREFGAYKRPAAPAVNITEEGEETIYYGSDSRPPPPPPFQFGYKRQPIDWRILHGIDIDRMVSLTCCWTMRCILSTEVFVHLWLYAATFLLAWYQAAALHTQFEARGRSEWYLGITASWQYLTYTLFITGARPGPGMWKTVYKVNMPGEQVNETTNHCSQHAKLSNISAVQVRETDIETLERCVGAVAFGDLEAEDSRNLTEVNFMRIFRLGQLTAEYLLHVQDRLAYDNCLLKARVFLCNSIQGRHSWTIVQP